MTSLMTSLKLSVVIAAVLTSTCSRADEQACGPCTATDGQPFPWQHSRLPESVAPELYELFLHPNVSEAWFTGKVQMHLVVVEPTDFFVFHASGLTISDVTLTTVSGPRTLQFLECPHKEQVYVELTQMWDKGQRLSVTVTFNGTIREPRSKADKDNMRGFYRSSYEADGETRYVASTQFEPTYARRAFPCLDEPALKANFSLRIVRTQKHITLFNTELITSVPYSPGLVVDTHAVSVRMSAYLVAWVVCDYTHVSERTSDGVTVRVFAPEYKIKHGTYALKTAVKLLDKFNAIFGLKYPMSKLDMIGIPQFAHAAMENWGLVTYTYDILYYDPDKSSENSKYFTAQVVAHELAHQWFGNLVTMQWWDDIWLNEGFATFVSAMVLDRVEPEFRRMTMDDTSLEMQGVMGTWDRLPYSSPVELNLADGEEKNLMAEKYSRIFYPKGGSLLRMLQTVMGEDQFLRGLVIYLSQHQWGTVRTRDLWEALQQVSALPAGLSVSKVMSTWTRQANFPVVKVTRSPCQGQGQCQMTLTQERYLGNGQRSLLQLSPYNYTWHIPFSFTTSSSDEPTLVWMDRAGAPTVDLDPAVTWVKGNAGGTGYYRVNYCEAGWRALTLQLRRNHSVFSVLDRAALVGDVFSLARGGHIQYDVVLNLTSYLNNEDDYVVWETAMYGILRIPQLATREPYKSFFTSLVKPHYDRLGWGTSGDYLEVRMRSTILLVAMGLEYPPAVQKALALWNDMQAGRPSDAPMDIMWMVDIIAEKYENSSHEMLRNTSHETLNRTEREPKPFEEFTELNAFSGLREDPIFEIDAPDHAPSHTDMEDGEDVVAHAQRQDVKAWLRHHEHEFT